MKMGYEFRLPDRGEGLTESDITGWLKSVGDHVEEDEPLLEIQNDKSVVEITSPVTGIVEDIKMKSGTAKVGQVLVTIDDGSGETRAEPEEPVRESAAKTAGNITEQGGEEKAGTALVNPKFIVDGVDIRMLAVPSVRKYAKAKGAELTEVEGTGRKGRITKEDIDRHLDSSGTDADRQRAAAEEEFSCRHESLPPMRKAISNALLDSVSKAPQVTVFDAVDARGLIAHRDRFKGLAAERGVRLTYTAYAVLAMASLLKRHPALNSEIDDGTGDLRIKEFCNIGVAVDAPSGLLVPNIKHADRMNLLEIADGITDMGDRARDGKLTSYDMEYGSVTVTNTGSMSSSGVHMTPLLNYPEAAILGLGRIQDEAVVNGEKEIEVRPVMKLSFTFDHRIIDGAHATQIIEDLKVFLADPETILFEG